VRFFVDTNVLLYAVNRDCPEHEAARRALEAWLAGAVPFCLGWNVLYEFLRVSTHPRVLRQPWTARDAWAFVEAVLASPALAILGPTERHSTVAAEVIAELPHLSGNLFHDAHTAILMREHGIRRIYTRDTDFHRFPFLEPVDPVG